MSNFSLMVFNVCWFLLGRLVGGTSTTKPAQEDVF
jgi:hypothetical protein